MPIYPMIRYEGMYADDMPPKIVSPDIPKNVKLVKIAPACRKNVVTVLIVLLPMDQPTWVSSC